VPYFRAVDLFLVKQQVAGVVARKIYVLPSFWQFNAAWEKVVFCRLPKYWRRLLAATYGATDQESGK
jgi:hypothetical protein